MRADREAGQPVVGEHPLPVGLLREVRHRRGGLERQRKLAVSLPHALRARDDARAPEELPPRPEAVAGARGDERLQRGPVHRRAPGEVGDVGVRLLGRHRLGLLLADRPDVAEPDPHGAVLDQALRPAQVDVGRPHLHPAPLAVSDEAGRRVEAHRLRVQERAQELGRIVVAEPGRLVGKQRERGRVRLREPEAGEADELVVDAVGELLVDALAERALDEPRPERLDRLGAPLAAHRAPQPLRLADGEPGQRHRHLEHLVLEDDDAERLAQRLGEATGGRPAGRTTGLRAASAAARCTGGRRRPGSAPAGRARPGSSGRRGSPAACAAGSASGRGSRSGSRRRCRRAGSRRRRPGRRAGCGRGRSARPGGGRSGRRSPRPPRASRGRAGRSSGTRRRRRSPCPTGRSAAPPSPPAGRGRARRAAWTRSPSRRGAARCAAAGRRSRARARRGRASGRSRGRRGGCATSSTTRWGLPSVTRASRSSSANGRPSALPRSRIAPREW